MTRTYRRHDAPDRRKLPADHNIRAKIARDDLHRIGPINPASVDRKRVKAKLKKGDYDV